ncbi:MAG: hypothetical protein ABTD50_03525 [Polyangiaceae bacterium]|jgi:hypothetical protein
MASAEPGVPESDVVSFELEHADAINAAHTLDMRIDWPNLFI